MLKPKYKKGDIVEYSHTDWWDLPNDHVDSYTTTRKGNIEDGRLYFPSVEIGELSASDEIPRVKPYEKTYFYKINGEWVEECDINKT